MRVCGCVCVGGGSVTVLGVGNCRCNSVCATPWWPRKRPALLDRPVSIVAVPRWLISWRENEMGEGSVGGGNRSWIRSLDPIMCLRTEEVICFTISGAKWKRERSAPLWPRRRTTGVVFQRRDAHGNNVQFGFQMNPWVCCWPSPVCCSSSHWQKKKKTLSHYLLIHFDRAPPRMSLLNFETRQMD